MTTIATQIKNAHVEYDADRNFWVKDESALSSALVAEAADWSDDLDNFSRTYTFKDGSKLIQKDGELIVMSIAKELFNAYKATSDFDALDASLEELAMEVQDTERGTEHIFTDSSRIVTRGRIVCFLDLE